MSGIGTLKVKINRLEFDKKLIEILNILILATQQTLTCSNSTVHILEKGLKSVQS